jgi:branched-chain amino acid transport system substrate-binding protein
MNRHSCVLSGKHAISRMLSKEEDVFTRNKVSFALYQPKVLTLCRHSREGGCEKIHKPRKLRRRPPLPQARLGELVTQSDCIRKRMRMGEAGPLAVRMRGNVLKNKTNYPSSCPSPKGRRNAVAPACRGQRFSHTLENGNPCQKQHLRLVRNGSPPGGRQWSGQFLWRLALLALAAFALDSLPAACQETYDINVVLPLTGRTSFLGQAEQKALQILEKNANSTGGIHGKPLRFIFLDDQSSPQVAVQLTSGIVASNPSVMMGSAQVAMCNAMAPLLQNGPVTYCFSPGIHPKEGAYVFTSSVSTHDLAAALIRYFRMKGWTKIALMTTTDASGQDAERGVQEVLSRAENSAVQLVENVHFNPSDVSVAAQIERVRGASPQAFIAWTTGAPVATVFKAVTQAGLDIPVATTDGNMTHAQMAQYAGFLPKELYIPASQWAELGHGETGSAEVTKAQKTFDEACKQANMLPDSPASLAWDPGMILIQTLRTLPEKATAADIRDHISKIQGFAGINGVYDFRKIPQRGVGETEAVVTRWNPAAKVWDVVSKPAGFPKS